MVKVLWAPVVSPKSHLRELRKVYDEAFSFGAARGYYLVVGAWPFAFQAALDPADGRRLQTQRLLLSNAQYCTGLFGKDAALELLSKNRWV